MPNITIYGTPETMSQDELEKLMQEVVETIDEVSGMDYAEDDVMVWFPLDRMVNGLGYEFSIDVAPLNGNAVNHADDAAYALCKVVERFFPDYRCIQCNIRRFGTLGEGNAVLRKLRTT